MQRMLEEVCAWHGQLSTQLELVERIRDAKSSAWSQDNTTQINFVKEQLGQIKAELQNLDLSAPTSHSQYLLEETSTQPSEEKLQELRTKVHELSEQLTALQRPLHESLELETQLSLQHSVLEHLKQDIAYQQAEADHISVQLKNQKERKDALTKRLNDYQHQRPQTDQALVNLDALLS